MSNKSNLQLHSEFGNRLREVLVAAEGDSKISIPKSGNSGVSVGPLQLDLAKQDTFREQLIEIGVQNKLIEDSKKGRADADGLLRTRNGASAGMVKKAEELGQKLAGSPGAADALAAAEKAQLNKVKATVERICGQAGADAKAFCGSLQGQLELASHIHQFGPSTEKLEAYLRGETIELDSGKNKTKIEGPLTVEQFRGGFRGKTKWAGGSKDGSDSRNKRVDDFFQGNNIDDGSKTKLNPPAPPPPIPVPRDTAPKPDAAEPEKHSALPEDAADAPAQSAAASSAAPASEDENRFIVGWTMQPDMTSRPIWGNAAQYDAYKAQQAGADAGVEAANDVAPVQSASLQQPAPEQNTNLLEMASLMPDERSSRGPKVWSPDSGALADAVMQAGGTGLPIWAQMLLGRDAMTNGSRAAVKGLQNAINAATKPPGFDYHWGLGGREGRIDVDGDLGPQTMAGFGRAVDKHGDKGFARIYALDQFGRYTKGLDTGMSRIGDLEDTLASTLGQVTPDAGARAQETLNIARDMVGDRQRYAPLKVDGWVGPVTSDAFKRAYDTFGSTRLFERFAGPDFWDEGV